LPKIVKFYQSINQSVQTTYIKMTSG